MRCVWLSRLVFLFVIYGRAGSSLFLFVFIPAGASRSMFFRAFFTFRIFFSLGFSFALGLFSLIAALLVVFSCAFSVSAVGSGDPFSPFAASRSTAFCGGFAMPEIR